MPPVPTPALSVPTETSTVTPTSTATIIWFPATATFTPMPTRQITPTPDLRLGLGETILQDNFTDKESWQTLRSANGSIAYGQGELTLAVSSADSLLNSLRKVPLLTDFYMELEAEPSLCRGSDAYGLLLRAETNQDFYRLLVNCNGEVRFERVTAARSLPLQDWTGTGLPPGGIMPVRLGIWALENEMRIFINDAYQFTVKDPVWTGGQIGVFARSAGDTPLTVNFSDLKVYDLEGGKSPLPMLTPTRTRPSPTP